MIHSLIDDYLAQAQLSDENRDIVSSWKKHISGKFILERHLKKGSIFISLDDEKVYLVKGLNSTWREMLDGMPPPVLLNATLLPWKDVIISDGLVASFYYIQFPVNSNTESDYYILTPCFSIRFTFDAYKIPP